MDLRFINPGFNYSIESILLFQTEKSTDWWRSSLFEVFPQLNRGEFDLLAREQQPGYLSEKLYELYKSEEKNLAGKVNKYNEHLNLYKDELTDAFSTAFEIDCRSGFNKIVGNIVLNPICPRFLDTHTFDVFYKYSEKGALGVAIHEIIHFVWFDVWHLHFDDDKAEYETPHLKWIFSEAAVDTVTRNDKRLSEKYPYTTYAYESFYSVKVDGVPLLEALNGIYKDTDIIGFMEKGYELFKKFEPQIRAQINFI